uniref:Predicted protein n=1 Tax=Physcomitrium patens TaxID=3218 RepID=A9U5C8_PHYPA
MSHAIDARICRDEEEVDIGYKQPTNEKNGYNQRVRFEDSSDKEMETLSHYTRKHWARATTEVLVKVGDIEEPIVALVDHGSEINLMSKDLYKKQKWPIDMEHGWAIRVTNNTRGELYGACPDVKIRIGDVTTEQHFFVQDTTSYPLILGQPYTTAIRMETKVLDDGSAYARIRSEDGRKAVQFLTVPPNHERNRDRLREKPLPMIVEGFKDFGKSKTDRLLDYRQISILPSTARRPARSRAGKHAVLFSVPFQGTLFSVKRSLKVQPSTSLSKKADMGMEEIIRGMRDLQIKLARLEENTSINNSKNVSKQGYVQRCIWCDDASHTRKDCNEFNNMIRQEIICWKDGKIALKDREDLLQTNFGKGGMRALVQDYLKEHETVVRESASYGATVDDEIGGSTETSEFWASAVSTIQERKLPREALLRSTATIRGRTGWEDLVESLSVHAYIAKSQHETLMEEKRRGNFDDTREGNSFKRQTRGDKAREAASQELPVKDTSASLGEKTTETKDKSKSIAYKLLSDIEAATNLKGVLEERILNAKVEFTLKEVLGIAKKEFHDVIIDSIKRKRQLMSKTGMSHAIDARICRDEEEVDIGYKQPTNEKNGYNQRVRFEDSSDKEMETLSHYTRKHWARATTEVLVKVGDIEEPIVALVDHGSEINLMSKDLYKKQKWPIDMEHGWAIRVTNNTRGELYGACPDVKIRIGDVTTEQHFFVQDTTSYPLILGQPYTTAIRMETKVLDDGSAYARIRSEDGRKAVQFLTVPPNHERNRDRLREKPLPMIVEGFKDFGKIGTLQDDERILDIYEENGLEDSLELITSIGLGDNDKIVEIHSREVYTMLESFQGLEVTVETRYKTADKKVKPVAGPLPEDSKEQMGEASKEASLRDPMSIGHQFTEETFEELKIGSDGREYKAVSKISRLSCLGFCITSRDLPAEAKRISTSSQRTSV